MNAFCPPSPVANEICSLKTHGFQHSVFDLVAFLHGKTPVFPTPFPDFQSNYGYSLRLPPVGMEGIQKCVNQTPTPANCLIYSQLV
jgi:hypothetical protein